ncbi:TPA: hypothetical protein N6V93_002846 [Escherichia coli]|uniref:Phage-like element PBSX protein XkdF domain-containing protein n=1 Tax=Escherichia phage JES2013 TaxID=1327956 RepID=S4USV5_9CAUD|nr:DNA methyltransferase [Escherichia phage JES2013]AGM12450.1 hypothetical protein Ec2_0061 [Escherichia phage JES2013]HCN4709275.1 hypothetical protein [Escherichia coli]
MVWLQDPLATALLRCHQPEIIPYPTWKIKNYQHRGLQNLLWRDKIIHMGNKMPQEEMISYEIIYEPDTKDAHGEWMSKDTIKKAKDNWDAAYAAGLVSENLFHLTSTDAFTIEKTWIQEEFDVVVIGTEQVIKAGSWVAKVKYNNPELWEAKKAGIVGGLSIQATGNVDEETGEITNVNFGISVVEEGNE